jgi:hypothetical protein
MTLRLAIVLPCVLWAGCLCGAPRLVNVPNCEMDPDLCDAGIPVVEEPDAGPPPPCTDLGTVTGRVCAPDQMTWVNGAVVSVDALDCQGKSVRLETTSAADGTFTLANIPAGTDVVVHADLGAFSQDIPVTVRANATTSIPDNQLCVAQKMTRIAVVTGAGDKIEDLLTTLRLQFTLFGGDSSTWTTQGEPFLLDLPKMKEFDLIFVNCAAAKKSGTTIDLGPNGARIKENLRQYVLAGGSVYASDWALLFTLAAAPSSFTYPTRTGASIGSPFDTKELLGYAPQIVAASVSDPGLAQFLGKSSLTINFPKESGANSQHWGLMANMPGTQVLVTASAVSVCADAACANAASGKRNGVPLAVRVRLLPTGKKGGNVVYTSFHNVAQTGTDVAQVLKYLVLNL